MRWIISRKNETLQQLWQWLCHASKSMWFLCQIISYLDADSYTSAIRNAISLGGDADTMACMAGGIAVATKGMEMPEELARCVYKCLMIIFVRYLMSLTGAIKQDSCRL